MDAVHLGPEGSVFPFVYIIPRDAFSELLSSDFLPAHCSSLNPSITALAPVFAAYAAIAVGSPDANSTTSFLTALRLLAMSMVSFHRDCIFT